MKIIPYKLKLGKDEWIFIKVNNADQVINEFKSIPQNRIKQLYLYKPKYYLCKPNYEANKFKEDIINSFIIYYNTDLGTRYLLFIYSPKHIL